MAMTLASGNSCSIEIPVVSNVDASGVDSRRAMGEVHVHPNHLRCRDDDGSRPVREERTADFGTRSGVWDLERGCGRVNGHMAGPLAARLPQLPGVPNKQKVCLRNPMKTRPVIWNRIHLFCVRA